MPSSSQCAIYPSISANLDHHACTHTAITSRSHLLVGFFRSDSHSSEPNSDHLSRTESGHTTSSRGDQEDSERSCLRKVSHGIALLQKSLSVKSSAASVSEYGRSDPGVAGGAQGRNDSTATMVAVSRCSTVQRTTSVYSGRTMLEDMQKEKGEKEEEKVSTWVARCKAKMKCLRVSSKRYAKLEECESEKAARREAKRQKRERKRKERMEWLLETGSDYNYGYGGIYGASAGGPVDWRLCMGAIF